MQNHIKGAFPLRLLCKISILILPVFITGRISAQVPANGNRPNGVTAEGVRSTTVGDRTVINTTTNEPYKPTNTGSHFSVSLKTNLLYGIGTYTPNIGIEFGTGPRSSINIMAGYNPWNRMGSRDDNKKLVHWMVQPEYRYWFCQRSSGHFIGAHAIGTRYNVGTHDVIHLFEKEYRYDGWGVGAGVTYGYSWKLSRRWALEAYIGLGAMYMEYGRWDNCDWCGRKLGDERRLYVGPTKAGVTLSINIF